MWHRPRVQDTTVHVMQALYQLSHIPSPLVLFYETVSYYEPLAGLELLAVLSRLPKFIGLHHRTWQGKHLNISI